MNLTELTGTTGLFLMTVIGTGGLGDGFTIRNLGLLKVDHHLIIVLNAPFEGTEMELTLTIEDNLTKLLGLLDNESGILLTHTADDGHHLLHIGLIYGLEST